jgi:hypothetical protein
MIRTTVPLALAMLLSGSVSAAPMSEARFGGADLECCAVAPGICPPERAAKRLDSVTAAPTPETDDVLAARGPEPYAGVLRQIAIYNAIGNHEGAEMLTSQLRALGVSSERIREAVTWLRVDAPHPGAPAVNAPKNRNSSRNSQ